MGNFEILFNTKLDVKNAEKQVNELVNKFSKKKISIEVEMPNYANILKNLNTTVNNYVDSQNRLITTTTKVSQAGKVEQQVVKQSVDEYGNLTKQIQLYTGIKNGSNLNLKKSGDAVVLTVSKEKQMYDEIASSLKVVETETNKYKNSQGNLVTEITKTYETGQKLKNVLTEASDGYGKITKTSESFVESQGKMVSTGEVLKETMNDTSKTVDNVGTKMESTARSTESLASKIVTATGKVALFKVSTTLVSAFYGAIDDAKNRVVEYDKSLTELKKVWDDSYGSLDKLSKKLSEIGKETANTLTNMTDIATGIVKAGYSNESDIAVMSEYVAKLQNTADEELTAAEATSILVSQLKAYGMEASEASKVTDILNAVSAQQAVSSGDLSKALTVGSSSMATYGNSIEETTALITAGTTVMQNRSQQVSRGKHNLSPKYTEMCIIKYNPKISNS